MANGRKPIIFGSIEAPDPPKAPDPPPKDENGWSKAVGQVASAVPKLARKSTKPWPKGDESSAGDAGKA